MNIYPWQLDLIDKMQKYKGRGCLQITGRQVGKSAFTAQVWKKMMDDIYNRPVENLILTENRIGGARYYCVQPVGGNWIDMEAWVTAKFGQPGEIWPNHDFVWPEMPRWVQNNRKFWFRNEADRTMFVLKWR